MSNRPQLPPRPDLEQLKRRAKELLAAARSRDRGARARFRALPALAGASDDELAGAALALHDAQSVVAREHGFASWNALRAAVEEATLGLDAAVAAFVDAATGGRNERARRLLELVPAIAGATFETELLLADPGAVEARLAARPEAAREIAGPRGWEPLLVLAHSSLHRADLARAEDRLAIARRLLALGADPNARFPWLHHGVRRSALWGAVFVARQLPLAELLLEAGADPDDGVTLPIAAGAGDLEVLELLVAHGADVDQRWASDGSAALYSFLDWATTSTGAVWLLEHGADPDPVFPANGESPLHAVARTGDGALAERLLALGADAGRRRADGRTPLALAELCGHREVAERLRAHGAADELSEVDRLVAAGSRGDGGTVARMLAERPSLRAGLASEHDVALQQAAERGDVAAVEALLVCGLDPSRGDASIGKTPLHAAAMAGRPAIVRALLAHGADVRAEDREFHAQPLAWAAEGLRSHARAEPPGDYDEVARLLIAAGSPTDWIPGEEPASEVLEILAGWRLAYGGPTG
jgi:ankyrin repeat protein